ncbi:hypothetical protein N1851_028181 [Merluccius polli]|uniref:Uncharacterized protein n=1 Tax=Merluccius polli TaxID=89951 RepID=A0AA47M9D5_MERPO|nr:hypothetical protein N1851_028181 [Merluccius polli]
MYFEVFTATPFYQQELEALKQRGTERKRVTEEGKQIKTEQHSFGRLCRFCHQPLKQGRTSPHTPPSLGASLRAACIGPIKTGGLIFMLDHSRWTEPMRAAIDGLLAKHHGRKDILKWVDADYAALVQTSCRDPNSLLHPTTRQHISRYVKHIAKLKNASTSLNTSPEKHLETQQLWQSDCRRGQCPGHNSATCCAVNPATTVQINQADIERVVREVLEKKESLTAAEEDEDLSCLACGQPKSRYLGDGSSIHFFHQAGEVRYFFCSKKVYQAYAGEGLTNPRMTFEDFAATPFYQRELESLNERGAERKRVKEERSKIKTEQHTFCRFCHQPLKQGPTSPHVHATFPGVTGKYIYCPQKVLSLYRTQGMTETMTWRDFQQSKHYGAEKQRWTEEKGGRG